MIDAGLIVLGFALGVFTAFGLALFAVYRAVRGPFPRKR